MKSKWIDHISKIMSKCHDIFTENFTIIFSNAGKTVNVLEFEFDKFWKTIFWRLHRCNIYIITTIALDFKQLYIFYIFFPIKWIYLSERTPYLTQTFNYSSQKQLHISKSVCVVFHWKQMLKVFVNCKFLQKSTTYKRNHLLYIKSLVFWKIYKLS